MAKMDSIVELLSGVFTIFYPLTETQVEHRLFDCLESRGGEVLPRQLNTTEKSVLINLMSMSILIELFTCICHNCASDQSLSYAIRLARNS